MSKTYSLLCALGLCLLLVGVSAAQTPFTQNFLLTDGPDSVTLSVGTALTATYCLGSADSALGENELPPQGPTDVFDCRFTDLDGYSCKGQGVSNDMRPLGAGFIATDTFKLSTHAGGSATTLNHVTMSWTANLSTVDGGYWMLYNYTTGLPIANLDTMQSIVLSNTSGNNGTYLIYHGDGTQYLSFDYSRLYSADNNLKPKPQTINKPGGKKVANWTSPNVFNLGTFSFAVKGTHFSVGDPLSVHSVYVKAWSAVTKSSANKLVHWTPTTTGAYAEHCLDSTGIVTKPGKAMKYVKKALAGLSPGKDQVDNWLFAQLLTLHATEQMYTAGVIVPNTFSALKVASGAYAGWTVLQMATHGDSLISCEYPPTDSLKDTATYNEFANQLLAINDAFTMGGAMAPGGSGVDSAPLKDTLTIWNTSKGKTVTVQGSQAVATQTTLRHSVGGFNAPHVGKSMIEAASKPEHFQLDQNYPNPFNPTTEIRFSLSTKALVTLKVYNILGQEVTTLANNEEFGASAQTVTFNANNYASGTYFYTLRVNDAKTGAVKFTDVKKMVLVK